MVRTVIYVVFRTSRNQTYLSYRQKSAPNLDEIDRMTGEALDVDLGGADHIERGTFSHNITLSSVFVSI